MSKREAGWMIAALLVAFAAVIFGVQIKSDSVIFFGGSILCWLSGYSTKERVTAAPAQTHAFVPCAGSHCCAPWDGCHFEECDRAALALLHHTKSVAPVPVEVAR